MSGQWKLDWIGLWRGWIAGGGKGREWPSLEGFDRCLVATDNAEDGPWGDGQGISLWGNRWAMNVMDGHWRMAAFGKVWPASTATDMEWPRKVVL